MRIAFLTLFLVGCATGSVATVAPLEPTGMSCTPSSEVCGPEMHCVVANNAPDGICSRKNTNPMCLNSQDCEDGSYCHKPTGQNGVCFKP